MAKKDSFQMLYAIKATVRRFEGNTENTVAITVAYDPNALEGTRVYRGVDTPWVQAIIESDEELTKEAILEMEDNTELDIDAIELEEGRIFNEKVPPMFQYFVDRNGNEAKRTVSSVTGVITKSSGKTVADAVRSTMSFRLTALDENGQHRYGIPNRKSIQMELLAYWDGSDIRDFDQVMDDLLNEVENESEA